jgi:hypothetical protein
MPPPFASWHVATSGDYTADGDYSGRRDPSDVGHGVVFEPLGVGELTYPRLDTSLVRESPDSSTRLVGAVVSRVVDPGNGTWVHVWAPVPLTPNRVEFAYEESGIPFDSVDTSGRWRRVILGFTKTGEPWKGWLLLTAPRLRDTTWRELFRDNMLNVRDYDGTTFHTEPDGPVVTTAKALAKGGFDVTSVELRGEWIKVEHPGESCAGDLPKNRKADYWWIRGFDGAGRPKVFIYPRGC